MNLEELTFISYPHLRAEAAWNLAVEEALHLKAHQELSTNGTFSPIIRTYSFAEPSVILGYRQKMSEIDAQYCKESDIHVTMRKTGGGSVCLGSEDIQYTFILPQHHTKQLLSNINSRIIAGLQDAGYSPQLKSVDNHPVIRLNGRSFVFDAQRRYFVNGKSEGEFNCALLHHGTILVNDGDYSSHLQRALRATPAILSELQNGNAWLQKVQQVKEVDLIKALGKNLPFEQVKIVKKDYPSDVLTLARKLYDEFYSQPEMFSHGQKEFGICYRPSTKYDMELYAERQGVAV